jgi:ABC-type nitrate/sulfonate/bicarbonate transport system ATPase subunit
MRKPGAHIGIYDLSYRYRRAATEALNCIDLEIKPCESVVLIGRSGCGKSTLLHLLAGLMPATSGEIHIDGARVRGPSPRWIVMFQHAALYPWMNVSQNIALGLRFAGRKNEIATRIPELLKLVELDAYAQSNVQELSGGQQQRVALARSLAVYPEVLLLDEPFSALDTFTRSALQRDIRRIAKDIGITLVTVTHDINEAVLLADRCIVMSANPGRIVSELPIDLTDEERFGGGPRVRKCHSRLRSLFEDVAGIQDSGNTVIAGDSRSRQDRSEKISAVV